MWTFQLFFGNVLVTFCGKRREKVSMDYSIFFWFVNKCTKTIHTLNKYTVQYLTFNCRYSEAIEILYSCNMLDLDTDHLLTLPKLLIPPHFNAIRFLNITLPLEERCSMFVEVFFERFSKDVRDWLRVPWLDVWMNIASMEGLRELHVQMTVPLRRRRDWVRDQISLLEPLKVVTRPKVFLLTLPFRDPAEDESFLQELPCQIQRAPQAIDG